MHGIQVGDVVRWDDENNRTYYPTVAQISGNALCLQWHKGFYSWQHADSPKLSVKRGDAWQTVTSLT